MKIRFALFDMDGTVVDSLGYWDTEWKILGEKFLGVRDFVPPPKLRGTVMATGMNDTAVLLKKELGITADVKEIETFLSDDLVGFYRKHTHVKPGMEELLRSLHGRGVRMMLCTATDSETAGKVLEHFGLSSLFEGVVSCADADVGIGKSSPKVYEKALRLLGAPAAETLLFEDSYIALTTGKSIGLTTVGVEDVHNDKMPAFFENADYLIRSGETFSVESLFWEVL